MWQGYNANPYVQSLIYLGNAFDFNYQFSKAKEL